MNETDFNFVFLASCTATYGDRYWLRKTHMDQYTGSGTGDFVGHIQGKHVEIEMKVKPNRPSPEQIKSLNNVRRTGGFAACVIYTPECSYLVLPEQCNPFSYRDSARWLPLPHYSIPTREGKKATRLMLTALSIALGV